MLQQVYKPTVRSGAATDFILRCQRVQLLIHKKNESSLLGDGSGDPNGRDKEEDNDTSLMEELQEEGTAHKQDTNFTNDIAEAVLGVMNADAPLDDASAKEGEGSVVNVSCDVSQLFLLSKQFTYNSCISFTNLWFKNLVMFCRQVLMKMLVLVRTIFQC